MKISIKTFTGGFMNFRGAGRRSFFRLGENPNKDWAMLISGFLLASALLVGYITYFMGTFASGLALESASVLPNESRILDEEKLVKVIGIYEARKEFQESGEAPDIIDPSL